MGLSVTLARKCHQSQKEDIGFPQTGVIRSCDPPNMGARKWTWVFLQKKKVHLSTESYL